MKRNSSKQLIVALDVPTLGEAENLIRKLDGVVCYYKIGMELFTAHGWAAVELVQKHKAEVFLDLKFHDIPTTVARAAAVVCDHEVEMFNIHTLGGSEMMRAVRKTIDSHPKCAKKKPVLLGVTILTSHSQDELHADLGIQRKLQDQVLHLARLAGQAGLDGVVCSPQEIALLRAEFKKDFIIVTPGIRLAPKRGQVETSSNQPVPFWDDQKRIMTPREALCAGSDYIVIGRPITAASHPRQIAEEILRSL